MHDRSGPSSRPSGVDPWLFAFWVLPALAILLMAVVAYRPAADLKLSKDSPVPAATPPGLFASRVAGTVVSPQVVPPPAAPAAIPAPPPAPEVFVAPPPPAPYVQPAPSLPPQTPMLEVPRPRRGEVPSLEDSREPDIPAVEYDRSPSRTFTPAVRPRGRDPFSNREDPWRASSRLGGATSESTPP